MRKLNFGHMGNGMTVWIKGTNDIVAHISTKREVTYYDYTHSGKAISLTDEEKKEIEDYAANGTPRISYTQNTPVFSVPPTVESQVKKKDTF